MNYSIVYVDEMAEFSRSVQTELQAIRGKEDKFIQTHLRHFKNDKELATYINKEAFGITGIEVNELGDLRGLPNCVKKTEAILKAFIRGGSTVCYELLVKLTSKYDRLLHVISTATDDPICSDYSSLTKDVLQHHEVYLSSTLKINEVLDMLLERSVLSIDDHDQVQRERSRTDKRNALLHILFQKPNTTWVNTFIHILYIATHRHILDCIKQQRNAQADCNFPEDMVQLGHTMPILYSMRISSVDHPRQNDPNVVRVEDARIIQQCINADLINVQSSSLYFLLGTESDTIKRLIRNEDEEQLMKFLSKLFTQNVNILNEFDENEILHFELEEKDNDIVQGFKRGPRSWIRQSSTDLCSGCVRKTIERNYKDMIDEVENDIIQDTFHEVKSASRYIKDLCSSKDKTRREIAAVFLQYVMHHEDALEKYWEALKFRSEVKWPIEKCSICDSSKVDRSSETPQKFEFWFKAEIKEKGIVNVMLADKESQFQTDRSPILQMSPKHYVEKMPKTPQEVLELHAKLTTQLEDYMGSSIDLDQYDQLKNRLKAQLTPKQTKNAKSIMDLINSLESKGQFGPGNYDKLKTILGELDVRIVEEVIQPIEEEIKAILASENKQVSLPLESNQSNKQNVESQAAQPSTKKLKLKSDGGSVRKHEYDTNGQRGLMLILNFSTEREGSENDVEKIKELFSGTFDFEIEEEPDLTKDKLFEVIEEVRDTYMITKRKANKYYCFVCIIMSYGDEKGIQTQDKQSVHLDDIIDKFKNKETPGFVGKPKIFIVQACSDKEVQQTVEADHWPKDKEKYVGKLSVPHDADLLIAYATTRGYKAIRTKYSDEGVRFIDVLLKVISDTHHETHLEEMLVGVRYEIAVNPEYKRQGYCQMPCSWTTLTKKLYFRI